MVSKEWKMKQQLQSWFSSKKTIAGIGTTALLIFAGVFQHNISTKITNLNSMQGGLSTCFSRVNQSYTAKVIGDGTSMYLESGFMKTTEECLSETSAFYEKEFGLVASKVTQAINALMTDVNWFHERVEESSSTFTEQSAEVALGNLSDRFEKLEMKYDKLDGELISKVEGMSLSKENLNLLLFTLSFLAPLLLLWDFAEKKKLQQRNLSIEKSASDRINSGDPIVHTEVGNIIREALEQNQLVYCSKLFSQYHALNPAISSKQDTVGRLKTLQVDSQVINDSKIDEIWQESEREDLVASVDADSLVQKYEGPTSSVDSVLTKVVDHLSNKLLADGVMIDLDASEAISVKGENEAIEQVIYNVVMNAIKNCQQSDASKKITINARRIGSNVCVNLLDSGEGFSKEFLTAASGLGDIEEHMPLSLKISRELVEDVDGSMSFENIYESGAIRGAKVQIVLRNADIDSKRVANIQKGTKREILESMRQQSV